LFARSEKHPGERREMPWHQRWPIGELNADTDSERQQDAERSVAGDVRELAQDDGHGCRLVRVAVESRRSQRL
jgi:hypothetical protein